jgi:hypothetical protein
MRHIFDIFDRPSKKQSSSHAYRTSISLAYLAST